MASVQPPGQVAMGLPPGFTTAKAREAFHLYNSMKEQGVPPNDPEFMRLHQTLTSIRNASIAQRQQKADKNSAQHQLNGGAVQVNGINTNGQPTQSSPLPPTSVTAAPTQSSPKSASHTSSQSKPSGHTVLSQEQVAALKLQIYAFRQLSKNLGLPSNIQQQLFASQRHQTPPVANNAIVTPTDKSPQVDAEVEEPADEEVSRPGFKTFTAPQSLVKTPINYYEHSSRNTRIFVPSMMPPGVDYDRIVQERERIIYNKMSDRRDYLNDLPANISGIRRDEAVIPELDEKLKLRTVIEYKGLGLLRLQRKLRQSLSRDMIHFDSLTTTANRSNYRRMKKQSLREARMTEKLEHDQRAQRANREKGRQREFLQAVINQKSTIVQNASNANMRAAKLGRAIAAHHQQIEKDEAKRIERLAKQRLAALKTNDEAAYIKLLDQTKDTRISHLIKQTNGFLKQLTASVQSQQRTAQQQYGDAVEDEVDEDDSDDDEDEEGSGKNIDYYAVAHRISEEVHAQPSILVGGTLKEYQLKGLQWMISLYNNSLNGILADEMGLGKTIQTISLITYLIEHKQQNGPFLVIVPLSTLTNWNLEFEKWAPDVKRIVYKGPPLARKQQQQHIKSGNWQVLLTTYEYIIKDRPILSKIKWIHMIVDEGHRMKNAASKLSNTLTQYYVTRYRLILTGTPLQNNLPELWALLNFVLPTIFKSVKSFDEWFNTPFANTGNENNMTLNEEEQLLIIRRLHKVLRPFLLRRLKKDVEKDLPDKQETVIKCKFSALQTRLYKQLGEHQKLIVHNPAAARKSGLRGLSNMLMQLRKLCNHPYVFGDEIIDSINPSDMVGDDIWRTSGKFELLDRVLPKLQQSGHRVLMFFQMTAIMDIMEQFLKHRGTKFLRLDGSTKSDDRSELLKVFNAPGSEYFCFLLSTRAGGLGLNLQTADTVIIFDSDWNPHQDLQAQDRAHRIGQKNEVRILRLISSNSVEEKILERAQFKLNMDGKVIQAGRFDNKSTNEEREAMLRVMIESVESMENMEQDEQDDEELNHIMARSEDEVKLFKQMDEERDAESEYGPNKKLPRLMAEFEIPDVFLENDEPLADDLDEEIGRGARKRTQVKYDDGLTEEQWLEAVDNDEDTIEAAIERKQAKIAKRQSNKMKRGDEDEDTPERDISEPPPEPKKRGRKPKAEKRKAEDAVADEPLSKRKRGPKKSIGAVEPLLNDQDRTVLQKVLSDALEYLLKLDVDVEGEDVPQLLIPPFMKVVPKTQFPDYHDIIKKPIAMDTIKRKIKKEEYSSLREFYDDVHLMCQNCRTYNEDTSQLYKDANLIEESLITKLQEEAPAHPSLREDFDDLPTQLPEAPPTTHLPSIDAPLAAAPLGGVLVPASIIPAPQQMQNGVPPAPIALAPAPTQAMAPVPLAGPPGTPGMANSKLKITLKAPAMASTSGGVDEIAAAAVAPLILHPPTNPNGPQA
ncbi:MAG: hypothetical protein M1814_003207 [Vezdaea aestivalis]|nr:MAG: hypothetical protein M1814_003207 [Vezdaea aestivalis]